MIDKLDASLRFHQEALSLWSKRQEVLAANIANADTPGFKARDIDFSSQLSEALARGGSSTALAMSATSARHLSGQSQVQGGGAADLLYRTPNQTSMDGNTVEMDAERVSFAENTVHYEANLTILGSKIKSLLAAVQ